MGIGHQALMTYEEIIHQNNLKNKNSVMEMGAQIIDTHYQSRAKELVNDLNNPENLTAKQFYEKIGFEEYKSIDADGTENSFIFDLNTDIVEKYNFREKYDFVTNLGTSEHVFNQKNFFLNMHNLTDREGLMFHLVPFEGGINHGFFNYNPNLFFDIAKFNDYEILGFWYYSERQTKKFSKYSGYNLKKPFKYNNELIHFIDKIVKKNYISNSPLDTTSSIGILYKRKTNQPFQDPFQSLYLEDQKSRGINKNKIEKYSNYKDKFDKIPTQSPTQNIAVINSNIDHQKQIEELLGERIWNFKFKYLFEKKFYKKLFRLLLNKKNS